MAAYNVFKQFEEEHLIEIAKKKQFRTNPDALSKSVADAVSTVGLQKFLKCLAKEQLAKLTNTETEKLTVNAMVKKAMEEMEKKTPKKWWNGQDKELLDEVAERVDIEFAKGENKAEAILAEAERMGLENCFSYFSLPRLLAFAEGAGLDVQTTAVERVIECLINRENYVHKAKKEKVSKKSKTKPAIDKDISIVDLNSWYYLQDLVDWCTENDVDHRGTKQQLIRNIKAHFAGKAVSKKRPAKKEPKGARPTKKAKTTASPKSSPKKVAPKKSVAKGKKEDAEDSKEETKKGAKGKKEDVEDSKEETKKGAKKDLKKSTESKEEESSKKKPAAKKGAKGKKAEKEGASEEESS